MGIIHWLMAWIEQKITEKVNSFFLSLLLSISASFFSHPWVLEVQVLYPLDPGNTKPLCTYTFLCFWPLTENYDINFSSSEAFGYWPMLIICLFFHLKMPNFERSQPLWLNEEILLIYLSLSMCLGINLYLYYLSIYLIIYHLSDFNSLEKTAMQYISLVFWKR